MSLNNAVVWLDHTKAQVIHFDKNASESESMKTHSTHPHPHQKHGDNHVNGDDNTLFYKDIAAALTDSEQILVVGPAEEKTAFVSYLTSKMPAIADKIKSVETVDHPSEGQLLAYAREHFISSGGMQYFADSLSAPARYQPACRHGIAGFLTRAHKPQLQQCQFKWIDCQTVRPHDPRTWPSPSAAARASGGTTSRPRASGR